MATVTPVPPDLKWVDTANHTYDVDDPTFCSPESVISGLVSGFCERQAAVSPIFITGDPDATVEVNWGTASPQEKAAIVDSCVQHVIMHDLKPSEVGTSSYISPGYIDDSGEESVFVPVDGSFHPADHSTVVDGGVTKTTTYMTHMDGLIDSLVQIGEYKTDITGATAYTTFSQLALSASAAASAATSACALPVSGGVAYSEVFKSSFPAAWAKERKWMLEQLRYVGDSITLIDSIVFYGFNNGRKSHITVSNNGTKLDSVLFDSLFHKALSSATFGNESWNMNTDDNFTALRRDIAIETPWADDGWWDAENRIPSFIICYPRQTITAYGCINVYFGACFDAGATWDERTESTHVLSGTSVVSIEKTGTNNHNYVVESGATITLSKGTGDASHANKVSVSAGGVLKLGDSAYIDNLNLMDGAAFTQQTTYTNNSIYSGRVVSMYRNYQPGELYIGSDSAYRYQVNNGATVMSLTLPSVVSSYILRGGSWTSAHGCRLDYLELTSGASATYSGLRYFNDVLISSGCHFSMYDSTSDDGYIDEVTILSGGTATVTGFAQVNSVHVHSGGVLNLSALKTGEHAIYHLRIESGAIINTPSFYGVTSGRLMNGGKANGFTIVSAGVGCDGYILHRDTNRDVIPMYGWSYNSGGSLTMRYTEHENPTVSEYVYWSETASAPDDTVSQLGTVGGKATITVGGTTFIRNSNTDTAIRMYAWESRASIPGEQHVNDQYTYYTKTSAAVVNTTLAWNLFSGYCYQQTGGAAYYWSSIYPRESDTFYDKVAFIGTDTLHSAYPVTGEVTSEYDPIAEDWMCYMHCLIGGTTATYSRWEYNAVATCTLDQNHPYGPSSAYIWSANGANVYTLSPYPDAMSAYGGGTSVWDDHFMYDITSERANGQAQYYPMIAAPDDDHVYILSGNVAIGLARNIDKDRMVSNFYPPCVITSSGICISSGGSCSIVEDIMAAGVSGNWMSKNVVEEVYYYGFNNFGMSAIHAGNTQPTPISNGWNTLKVTQPYPSYGEGWYAVCGSLDITEATATASNTTNLGMVNGVYRQTGAGGLAANTLFCNASNTVIPYYLMNDMTALAINGGTATKLDLYTSFKLRQSDGRGA